MFGHLVREYHINIIISIFYNLLIIIALSQILFYFQVLKPSFYHFQLCILLRRNKECLIKDILCSTL